MVTSLSNTHTNTPNLTTIKDKKDAAATGHIQLKVRDQNRIIYLPTKNSLIHDNAVPFEHINYSAFLYYLLQLFIQRFFKTIISLSACLYP